MDPHTPYSPPPPFHDASVPWDSYPPIASDPGSAEYHAGQPSEDHKEFARKLYSGEIQYVDAALGELLRELEARQLAGRSYVLFSSDHGEELWERNRFGHGHSVHNELVRVPLAIAGPGIEPGVIDQPISAIDIMPTVADLTGCVPLEDSHGTSCAPLLRKERREQDNPAPLFSNATNIKAHGLKSHEMVLSGHWKLIRIAGSGERQLYNLAQDPKEEHSLAGKGLPIEQQLLLVLQKWRQSFPHSFDDVEAEPDPFDEGVEDDYRKTLEALGYL